MSKIKLKRLPPPDEFGNYWTGDHQHDPAIFPSKRLRRGEVLTVSSTWYVTMGKARGMLMDGLRVRTFPSAEEALRALNEAL